MRHLRARAIVIGPARDARALGHLETGLVLLFVTMSEARAAEPPHVTAENDYYAVAVLDGVLSTHGWYTAYTGSSHPVSMALERQGELLTAAAECRACDLHPGIALWTLRSWSDDMDIILADGVPGFLVSTHTPGFDCELASVAGMPVTTSGVDGSSSWVETRWPTTSADLSVTQRLAVQGESLAEAHVGISLTVTNEGSETKAIGARSLLPVRYTSPLRPVLASAARSFLGLSPPFPALEPYATHEGEWPGESVAAWEGFPFSATPSMEARGYRVAAVLADNGQLDPPPTPPDLVQLGAIDAAHALPDGGSYTRCFDWRVPDPPRAVDSLDLMSIVHYWGIEPDRARVLEPGESVTFVEYMVAYLEYPLAVDLDVPDRLECDGPATGFTAVASPSLTEGPLDAVAVTWTSPDPSVTFSDPHARETGVSVPGIGDHEIIVIAAIGAYTAVASRTVVVEDTRDPQLASLVASPSVLWPPNHRLHPVTIDAEASDSCDPAPSVRLVAATANEPDEMRRRGGDGTTERDIQGADLGSPDFDVLLRAERRGGGRGRRYTLTYEASDASGNTASASVEVSVPHSRRP